jgi:hypothetical protein
MLIFWGFLKYDVVIRFVELEITRFYESYSISTNPSKQRS